MATDFSPKLAKIRCVTVTAAGASSSPNGVLTPCPPLRYPASDHILRDLGGLLYRQPVYQADVVTS